MIYLIYVIYSEVNSYQICGLHRGRHRFHLLFSYVIQVQCNYRLTLNALNLSLSLSLSVCLSLCFFLSCCCFLCKSRARSQSKKCSLMEDCCKCRFKIGNCEKKSYEIWLLFSLLHNISETAPAARNLFFAPKIEKRSSWNWIRGAFALFHLTLGD